MIIQIRVDDRLIHGQIAVVWSKQFNTTHMVVANDKAAANEVQQMALKMATPSGIKVLIRSVDDAIKYSLQGTTQGRYLTGGVPPVRFSM